MIQAGEDCLFVVGARYEVGIAGLTQSRGMLPATVGVKMSLSSYYWGLADLRNRCVVGTSSWLLQAGGLESSNLAITVLSRAEMAPSV